MHASVVRRKATLDFDEKPVVIVETTRCLTLHCSSSTELRGRLITSDYIALSLSHGSAMLKSTTFVPLTSNTNDSTVSPQTRRAFLQHKQVHFQAFLWPSASEDFQKHHWSRCSTGECWRVPILKSVSLFKYLSFEITSSFRLIIDLDGEVTELEVALFYSPERKPSHRFSPFIEKTTFLKSLFDPKSGKKNPQQSQKGNGDIS